MIFHGRRFGLMTQIRRSRQIKVPMGGTLHHDRSNSRRSLSTTRQGKMRATCGMQNNSGDFMRRRSMTIENLDLWPSEPRTWGHRSGSLGQLDNMYNISLFPLGSSDPRVVWKNIKIIIEFPYSCIFKNYCKVVYNPIFGTQQAQFKETRK
jgi:hypothetical protein